MFQEKLYTDPVWKEEIEGFYRYKGIVPNANKQNYILYNELTKRGYIKGYIVPVETKRAYILEDIGSNDPAHILKRMAERNISADDIQSYVDNALFCEAQFNGQRLVYYSMDGTAVLTKTSAYKDIEWIAKTAWNNYDFTERSLKMLEVAKKYV